MKSRHAAAIAAIAGLAALPSPASANQIWCSGTVLSTWSNAGGSLYISTSWRGDHMQICNLRQDWKGVPAESCIAWAARLDAAVALNRMVTISYLEGTSCSALPTYEGAPAPVYVMMMNG